MKTLLIGLDGATFDLLNPLMEEGVLPNLSNIIKNGTIKILKSTIPCYTGPAWVSSFTGVSPGKHGILNFTRLDKNASSRRILNSTDIKYPKIWDIIGYYGLKSGIVNVPMTYPADKISEFMITGMLSPGNNGKVSYPSHLITEIEEHVGKYTFDLPINLESHKNDVNILDKINAFLHMQDKTIEFLLSKYDVDFFMTVFITPDRIQHLFWKYLTMGNNDNTRKGWKLFREKAIECYYNLDAVLGKLLCFAQGEGANIIFLSDHGFGEFKKTFFLNNWLIREGFLKINKKWSMLTNITKKLNNDFVKSFLPTGFCNQNKDKLKGKLSNLIVDYIRSKAYAAHSLEQGLYICESRVKEYIKLQDVLIEKLGLLRDPETGEKIVSKVYTKQELYGDVREIPDLFIDTADTGYVLSDTITNNDLFDSKENEPFGTHKMDGIFIACGKDIKSNQVLKNASIIDITPTVLYSLGLPIPDYMTGSIMEDIFTEKFQASHSIEKISIDLRKLKQGEKFDYTNDETNLIKERLQGLGYL